MEIIRTANAGVLLTLDDKKILLDGVCQEVKPYLATPPVEKEKLSASWPDAVAFTHCHEDHCDPSYARDYCKSTGRNVFGTTQIEQLLPNMVKTEKSAVVGNIRLTAVPTRHMGHYGKTTEHRSYVVEGSKTIWFLGDASPMELKELASFPRPDVLLIPYPYISTPAALKMVEEFLPCKIVLLHLPLAGDDSEGIWQSADAGMEYLKAHLYVPGMGEILKI